MHNERYYYEAKLFAGRKEAERKRERERKEERKSRSLPDLPPLGCMGGTGSHYTPLE